MSLFDHRLVTERYFFPRPDAPTDLEWVEVSGARLGCAGRRDHGGPLLLHFHGNGETIDDYLPDLAETWSRRGVDTLFAEYRGYGASSGTPQLVAMLEDVPALVAAAGVPPEQVFAYGRSIGSIYAIEAAHRFPQLGGLILESGIADVLERVLFRVSPEELGATPEELVEEASAHLDHDAKLAGFPGRVLVLHAEQDRAVFPRHAERNAASATRSELVMFERGDHNSILAFNMPAILDHVERFVRSA